jgi:hypothetical protein
MATYKMCEVCLMDTSDPEIVFFGNQGCSNCTLMRDNLSIDKKNNLDSDNFLKTINLIKDSKKKVNLTRF